MECAKKSYESQFQAVNAEAIKSFLTEYLNEATK